ncbi:hypothetical protein BJX61DRAFT_22907 [Aspergillus egyptiacus]|nr:hypothetical protein BJX61DRAFT_22907 [Aspergillus egyptiacus]
MASDLHLANGCLLNLQPRPRRGRSAVPDSDATDGKEFAPGLGTRSDTESDTSNTPSPRSKPTRLPVLKVFADKDFGQPKNVTSSPGQKEHAGEVEHDSRKSMDQEREGYWRRVRDRLDRDSPSPRNKEKQYHGAYRKFISLASSPRHEIAKHKWKSSGGSSNQNLSSPDAGAAAKTDSLNPECRNKPEDFSPTEPKRSHKGQGRLNSNRSASSSASRSSSLKYKTDTSDLSGNSNSSVSPISGPATSMTEWEDRFVVQMPSAREPNPPTTQVSQVTDYQKSIERVHTEGGSMLDPDTLPSPRTTTPEEQPKSSDWTGEHLGTFDGQDSRLASSANECESEPPTYLLNHHRYYSPEEVGKQRCSTIWEESSTGPKQQPSQTNPDGSFLGCKEIHGPNDRNPDEILFFSTPERPEVVTIPPRTSKLPKESKLAGIRQTKRAAGDTTLIQEEWAPISRNLKHAQCSKPSPKSLCRETPCQLMETKKSGSRQEGKNPDSTRNPIGSSENSKPDPRADDVFIITPTITRTMVTMTDLSGHLRRQPALREPSSRSAGEIITDARTRLPINTRMGVSPSGLRRASQNSWAKSKGPSATLSKSTPPTNIPAIKHQAGPKVTAAGKLTAADKPRGMRGFIRTPGIPRSFTESRIDHPSTKSSEPVPGPTNGAGNIFPRETTPRSPVRGNSRSPNRTPCSPPAIKNPRQISGTLMQAKIVDVAELDGQQVDGCRDYNFNAKTLCSSQNKGGHEIQSSDEGITSSETIHMIIDMVFLFIAQVQRFFHQIKANRESKMVLLKLLLITIVSMLEHCLHVVRKGLGVLATVNATGAWPKDNKDNTCSVTELGQTLVYLVVLGFIATVFARAVGFIILVGAWILWLTRPFTIAFRAVARIISTCLFVAPARS